MDTTFKDAFHHACMFYRYIDGECNEETIRERLLSEPETILKEIINRGYEYGMTVPYSSRNEEGYYTYKSAFCTVSDWIDNKGLETIPFC